MAGVSFLSGFINYFAPPPLYRALLVPTKSYLEDQEFTWRSSQILLTAQLARTSMATIDGAVSGRASL